MLRVTPDQTSIAQQLLNSSIDLLHSGWPFSHGAEDAKGIESAQRLKVTSGFEALRISLQHPVFQFRCNMLFAWVADGLREVADLPDPVGEITDMKRRPSGIEVGRMRIPLGVIGIVYESRPNVTADAAGLCLKSGNAVILRGGSEAFHSNTAIGAILQDELKKLGLPAEALQVVGTTEREAITELLKQEEDIDLIIPRGGEGLIRFVAEHSRIPVIKHYKGVCHTYVDAVADFTMAEQICLNAKVQRPGVCNSMETLLVHKDAAKTFVPQVARALRAENVELHGCPVCRELVPDMLEATEEDWHTEYLDLTLAIRVVDSIEQAIEHIQNYCSLHTEVIVTKDYDNAQRFLREVNSSVVMVNASSRFSDGNQFGLGAEIGISTTKLHSFGPMGLEDLTTRSSSSSRLSSNRHHHQ